MSLAKATPSIPSEKEFLEAVVPSLPQGGRIQADDAIAWYRSVLENDESRFFWHVDRLKGIGGSDMGEIAAWKLGVPALFKTPKEIIDAKLMKTPLEPQNAAMRRGSLLEPIIQQIFLEDFKATTRKDLIFAIDNASFPEHPWLRGNVDDVVQFNTGDVYVVDYKCPGEPPHGETPLQYAAQIHQYNYILRRMVPSLTETGLLVAYYDHPEGAVKPVEVAYDPAIETAVIEGGDEIWAHVLAGTYPVIEPYKKSDLQYDEEAKTRIAKLEEEFVRLKLVADAAYGELKVVQEELSNALSNHGKFTMKGQKVPLDVLGLTVRQNLNEETLRTILQETSTPADGFLIPSKKMDEEKMMLRLVALGENPEEYFAQSFDKDKVIEFCSERGIKPPIEEGLSPTLKASKKGLDQEAMQIAKDSALRAVLEGVVKVNLEGADPFSASRP